MACVRLQCGEPMPPCRLHKARASRSTPNTVQPQAAMWGVSVPSLITAQVQHPLPRAQAQKPDQVTAKLRDVSSPAPIAFRIPMLLVSTH